MVRSQAAHHTNHHELVSPENQIRIHEMVPAKVGEHGTINMTDEMNKCLSLPNSPGNKNKLHMN